MVIGPLGLIDLLGWLSRRSLAGPFDLGDGRNAGNLALDDVELALGRAETGGALYNTGVASLQQVALVSNSASRAGGAIHNDVGGELSATGLIVAGNWAWSANRSPTLELSAGLGGGIFNGGQFDVSDAQFVLNRSDNAAGAVENHGHLSIGEAQFERNLARVGGAIFAGGQAGTVSTTLQNVTSSADRSLLSDVVFELFTGAVTQDNVVLDAQSDLLGAFVQAQAVENAAASVIEVPAGVHLASDSRVLVRPGAAASVEDGDLLYSPAADFSGIDVIVFEDTLGAPHVLHVYVENVPANPVTANDQFNAIAWSAITVTLPDPDGSTLTLGQPGEIVLDLVASSNLSAIPGNSRCIVELGTPDHGGSARLVVLNDQEGLPPWLQTQRVLYRAAPDFVGDETFTYTVEDDNGLRVEATVTMHVAAMPDLIGYRLEARDLDGQIVQQVEAGDHIELYVYVADTTGRPYGGLFNASAGLVFETAQLRPSGDVEFGPDLPNGQRVSVRTDFDQPERQVMTLSAFGGLNMSSMRETLVAKVPMEVIAEGTIDVDFRPASSAAHILRDWPLGGVPFGSITFTGTTFDAYAAGERPDDNDLGNGDVTSSRHNAANPLDVNGDGVVTPADVLVLVNALNEHGPGPIAELPLTRDAFYDVNDDGHLSPQDVLIVVNWLNSGGARGVAGDAMGGEGESSPGDAAGGGNRRTHGAGDDGRVSTRRTRRVRAARGRRTVVSPRFARNDRAGGRPGCAVVG